MPYIESLIKEGIKVMVLAEHWLWPYELGKLDDINIDFVSTGKCDVRLTNESKSGRGCGGVGILWQKGLKATPIEGISSDRICGIRFNIDNNGGKFM